MPTIDIGSTTILSNAAAQTTDQLLLRRDASTLVRLPVSALDTRIAVAIDAAITALVNGAPGALDTINELAIAWANDESAIAALSNAINLRLTQSQADVLYSALGHTHNAADITNSTAAGRAMLTATDAAAQVALLGIVDNSSTALTLVNTHAAAVVAAGGTISLSSQRAIYDAILTSGILDATLWAKIKELWVPAGDDLTAARVKLKNGGTSASLTNSNFVAADYTERTALWPGTTNTNKKLASDINLATAGLSAATGSMGVYALSDVWTNSTVLGGSSGSTWWVGLISGSGAGLTDYLSGSQISSLLGRRLHAVSTLSGSTTVYRQGVSIASAAPASTAPVSFQLWSYNGGFYSNARIGGYYVATGLTATEIKIIAKFFDLVSVKLGRNIDRDAAVFFGDSFTAGSGAIPGANRFSTIVANRLGLTEINAGVSGTVLQNTAPILAQNGRDRYISAVLTYFGKRIFINYGVNDIRYNDAGFTAPVFEGDLAEVVAGLLDAGTLPEQITIGSPGYFDPVISATASAPWNGATAQRQSDYRDAARNVAARFGCVFRDVYQLTLDYLSNGLIYSDNLHPSNAGHEFIADALLGGKVTRCGKATLVAGTVTIPATWLAFDSTLIQVGRFTDSGTLGASYSVVRTGTSGGGTSFTITAKDSAGATQTADTSVVWWRVVSP